MHCAAVHNPAIPRINCNPAACHVAAFHPLFVRARCVHSLILPPVRAAGALSAPARHAGLQREIRPSCYGIKGQALSIMTEPARNDDVDVLPVKLPQTDYPLRACAMEVQEIVIVPGSAYRRENSICW